MYIVSHTRVSPRLRVLNADVYAVRVYTKTDGVAHAYVHGRSVRAVEVDSKIIGTCTWYVCLHGDCSRVHVGATDRAEVAALVVFYQVVYSSISSPILPVGETIPVVELGDFISRVELVAI